MESMIKASAPEKGRKKIADPSYLTKFERKVKKHTSHEPPRYPKCKHNGKTFRCQRLKMIDIKEFHDSFYSTSNKIIQDQFLLKYMDVSKPKRIRKQNNDGSGKGFVVKYNIRVSGTTNFTQQVCKDTFMHALHVSAARLRLLAKNVALFGQTPSKEKRGGARIKEIHLKKREAVRKFIENLKCMESHYCRSKSTRMYLPCDLSIRKLMDMYNAQNPNLTIHRAFFRKIFNSEYNVGFGAPSTDACSKCIEFSEMIKNANDPDVRAAKIIEQRIHKLRAKAFYSLLKEENPDFDFFTKFILDRFLVLDMSHCKMLPNIIA